MQNKPPYALSSVDNVLRLIELLRRSGCLRVSEAARELEIGQSTAHRLFSMLVFRGFAMQDDEHRYIPGVKLGTANQLTDYTKIIESVAAPSMLRLRTETRETVNLVVRQGTQVRFVTSVESPQLVRVGDRRGATLPMQKTSGGKAMLAVLPINEVRELFAIGTPDALLEAPEWAALLADLRLVRRRGYALNEEQTEKGVSALGVALVDEFRKPFAGLSVAAPSNRWSRRNATLWYSQIDHARTEIENRITSEEPY